MLDGDLLVLAASGDGFLVLPSVFILFSVLELSFKGDSPKTSVSHSARLHLPADEDVSTPSLALLKL